MRSALLVMFALTLAACGGGQANNAPRSNNPINAPPKEDIKFERVPLEELPERDPPYVWPSDGFRMAADLFWVSWKTSEFVPSRLIASRDGKLWYDLGSTVNLVHYLPVDLAGFGSDVLFSIEFEEQGRKFRSRPRRVKYGAGIRYGVRELDVTLEARPDQKVELTVEGGDLQGLSADDFWFALLPDELRIYGLPRRDSETSGRIELVIDGATLPKDGCWGFMEMRDSRRDTRDRVLLKFRRK